MTFTLLAFLTLATIGSWDILKRLLPVSVPTPLAKLALVGISLCLLYFAPHSIVLALSVPGVILLANRLIPTEAHTPWGVRVAEYLKPARRTAARTRPGNRIPRL